MASQGTQLLLRAGILSKRTNNMGDDSSSHHHHRDDEKARQNKKKKRAWLCDVCKVKRFSDLSECEAHEATCHGGGGDTFTAEPATVNHDATTTSAPNETTLKEAHAITTGRTKRSSAQKCDLVVGHAGEETTVDEKKANKSTKQPATVHPFFQGGANTTKSKKKTTAKQQTVRKDPGYVDMVNVDDINSDNNVLKGVAQVTQDDYIEDEVVEVKPTKPRKKKKTDKKSGGNSSSIDAFFQGAPPADLQAIQAAQRVAEFQAKRRRQQELERERRLKRQKQQQQQQADNNVSDPTPTAKQEVVTKRQSSIVYTRFPVPSHVVANESLKLAWCQTSNSSTGSWWNAAQAERANSIWKRHFPWSTHSSLFDQEHESPFIWNSPPCDAPLDVPCDLITQALGAFLMPSDGSNQMDLTETADFENGESLSDAEQQLAEFLQKWKDIREESHRRMTERHLHLAGRKKKAKKTVFKQNFRKSKYDGDEEDYFMSGSENEEEEDCTTSLFLLTGAVGVGKTSSVYKVAKQANCSVLEVNTTEIRGAAALRKRIQEATQTHAAKWNKTAGISSSLFQKSEPENEVTDATLTVILLDEVDILYPESGDNGFWSALSDVSKKAKAPIILTANQYPEALGSSAFRFEHVHMEASVKDCARHMLAQAQQEGLVVRPERQHCVTEDAERISYLAQCDYRRITNGIELLKLTLGDSSTQTLSFPRVQLLTAPVTSSLKTNSTSTPSPQITSVQPSSVPASSLSLITLTGEGFLSFADSSCRSSSGYSVRVKIGRQECPHSCIMNDSTIVAVCPPIFAKGGSRMSLLDLDLQCAPVSISAWRQAGILSTTCGMLTLQGLCDGTYWATPRVEVLLEYHTARGDTSQVKIDSESDEEREFDDCIPKKNPTPASIARIDTKASLKILQEGVSAWFSKKLSVPSVDEDGMDEDQDGLKQVEALCQAASYESDAAFLEDCGLQGLPVLVGGNTPFESAEKNNKFQFQKLQKEPDRWLLGSNSFVVRPPPREDRILRRTEKRLRGTCPFHKLGEEEGENDTPVPKEDMDDDVLLPCDTSTSFWDLPGSIRSRIKMTISPIILDPAFQMRREDAWGRQSHLLRKYAFALHRADFKLFCRGLNRDVSCLLDSSDYFDERLVLDYLPLLRNMAIIERAHESFLKEQENDEVVASLTIRSRSTRSSAKQGRQHYFETSFEAVKNLHDSEKAHEIGRAFAREFLDY